MKSSVTWKVVFALLRVVAVANAGVCDDCNLSCSWSAIKCQSRKALCIASGSLFNGWTGIVNSACGGAPFFASDWRKLNEAKKLLASKGLLPKWKLDKVVFRFCNYIGIDGDTDAFTSDHNRIYFDDSLRNWNTKDLAAMMAHEVRHSDQYKRWSYRGFACRYSGQIAQTKGFKCANYIEREAYLFSDRVRRALGLGRLQCS